MALAPTLYELDVALSHVDRSIDQRLTIRTARHPSESLERVWLRALAYCWLWDARIAFGPGLSDPDTPDIEVRDLTGEVTLWVRVGKADPGKLQRAADRNPKARVAVFFESPQRMEAFLAAAREEEVARLDRVELLAVEPALLAELASVDARRTKLTLTIVGDHLYLDRGGRALDGPLLRGSIG